MTFIQKLSFYSHHPLLLLQRLWDKLAPIIPDKIFLTVKFRMCMGYWMDFAHPHTYNEKLQWLKLYDRQPLYTTLVDKYAVKEYVSKRIGTPHIIPTIGVWEKPEDIPWKKLPTQFVAKVTHDSGGIVICKDKTQFSTAQAIAVLSKGLCRDYYAITREWPYRNVKRQILVEQYIEETGKGELKDYKFFCFNGEPKMFFIATDRNNASEETKFDFFDMQCNLLPFTNGHPHAHPTPQKPNGFETMVDLAKKLSKGIPHVRVDFYEVDGQVYFGEMTFYHWSGMVPFEPKEWDAIIGDWLPIKELTS